MDEAAKREQVAKQYKAVAHMARAIAAVHEDIGAIIADGTYGRDRQGFLDMIGRDSAARMEALGDILNGMDAVDDAEDEWLSAVFGEAHRLWPTGFQP